MSETLTGLELTGHGGGFEYALGWVNGSVTSKLDDVPSDVYLRIAKTFGQGEGQTAGQRIGLVGQFGQARPDPGLGLAGKGPQPVLRGGLDVSLNVAHFNLALQVLAGQDDEDLWGVADKVTYYGGFAELSYLPATDWAVLLRYDGIMLPDGLGLGDVSRLTAALRYYFWDNLALHLEYSYRHQSAEVQVDQGLTYHFATARLDIAF